ncbi:putative SOS response-associated peptidase YedK [Novosphingobium fluoreni]|uniref:Putative SOS response-associated peptidase YedK n=1 Tax=Novosphingobium fluoreni TaxID=1391222 RepID=A0A7W6C3M8_9SPHN|nr:putative SOS response-associated peptidase YedK [Novosphingobium fluoreni]
MLGGQAKWKMTNVRQLELPQWRKLAERPKGRCLVPLTEFCKFTPDKRDLGMASHRSKARCGSR